MIGRMGSRRLVALVALSSAVALASATAAFAEGGGKPEGTPERGGPEVIHVMQGKGARPGGPKTPPQLTYRGGRVSTNPQVYVVFWGSQWNISGGDPSGLVSYVPQFLRGLGAGESWSRSTTQYCMNVATGTVNCGGSGVHAGQPAVAFVDSWADSSVVAPSKPTQSQLAAEAAAAARHFGISAATASQGNVQIVVATAHNNNASGFGTTYCAWHSSTAYVDSSSASGTLAYTNLPYMPDAGASCGANFVNSSAAGLLDGVSIVEGHEYAEVVTDPFPNNGWLDSGGAENADKCAWSATTQNITLLTGSYPMQPLWSNASASCVQSY